MRFSSGKAAEAQTRDSALGSLLLYCARHDGTPKGKKAIIEILGIEKFYCTPNLKSCYFTQHLCHDTTTEWLIAKRAELVAHFKAGANDATSIRYKKYYINVPDESKGIAIIFKDGKEIKTITASDNDPSVAIVQAKNYINTL